jgi:hypothetical protein
MRLEYSQPTAVSTVLGRSHILQRAPAMTRLTSPAPAPGTLEGDTCLTRLSALDKGAPCAPSAKAHQLRARLHPDPAPAVDAAGKRKRTAKRSRETGSGPKPLRPDGARRARAVSRRGRWRTWRARHLAAPAAPGAGAATQAPSRERAWPDPPRGGLGACSPWEIRRGRPVGGQLAREISWRWRGHRTGRAGQDRAFRPGLRSSTAASLLAQAGRTGIFDLVGGIVAWNVSTEPGVKEHA